MEYRSSNDVERFQGDSTFRGQVENGLSNDETLMEELRRFLLHTVLTNPNGDFYETSVARQIAYHNSVLILAVRSRLKRYLDRLYDLGAIDSSNADHNEESRYRTVTSLGRVLLDSEGFAHVILGPVYTLQKRRMAAVLLVVGENHDSGTATHLGGGRFLTCAHCTPEGQALLLYHPIEEEVSFKATILARDEGTDLALLRCNDLTALPAAPLRRTPPALLDPVLVLHYPNVPSLLRTLIASRGEVVGRAVNIHRAGNEDILISARIAPGSSGAAILSERGEVTGVVVGSGASGGSTAEHPDDALARLEPFNHAIPSDQVLPFVASAWGE